MADLWQRMKDWYILGLRRDFLRTKARANSNHPLYVERKIEDLNLEGEAAYRSSKRTLEYLEGL